MGWDGMGWDGMKREHKEIVKRRKLGICWRRFRKMNNAMEKKEDAKIEEKEEEKRACCGVWEGKDEGRRCREPCKETRECWGSINGGDRERE